LLSGFSQSNPSRQGPPSDNSSPLVRGAVGFRERSKDSDVGQTLNLAQQFARCEHCGNLRSDRHSFFLVPTIVAPVVVPTSVIRRLAPGIDFFAALK
jgi:hypothetical protein